MVWNTGHSKSRRGKIFIGERMARSRLAWREAPDEPTFRVQSVSNPRQKPMAHLQVGALLLLRHFQDYEPISIPQENP